MWESYYPLTLSSTHQHNKHGHLMNLFWNCVCGLLSTGTTDKNSTLVFLPCQSIYSTMSFRKTGYMANTCDLRGSGTRQGQVPHPPPTFCTEKKSVFSSYSLSKFMDPHRELFGESLFGEFSGYMRETQSIMSVQGQLLNVIWDWYYPMMYQIFTLCYFAISASDSSSLWQMYHFWPSSNGSLHFNALFNHVPIKL